MTTVLDFGPQPLCNRFLRARDERQPAFPLRLGECASCRTPQLLDVVSADELRPRFDWIRYNEAEEHLDALVDVICGLPGVGTGTTIGALSPKDDSTVERFRCRGFTRAWRLDPAEDLHAPASSGQETVQQCVTPAKAVAIAAERGRPGVLIARHILEHAHEPRIFAQALRTLVAPAGYVVFEAPDCAPAFARRDYTTLWEEHVLYFTPTLLNAAVRALGFYPIFARTYEYSHENSIVVIASPAPQPSPAFPPVGETETSAFGAAFAPQRAATRAVLTGLKTSGAKIALFGAGHLTCTWVNLMDIADAIEFVADDDPNKRGLFMPGSALPIVPSSALIERGVDVCLLSLNQKSEARVVARHAAFTAGGGRFLSIFPGRPNSMTC